MIAFLRLRTQAQPRVFVCRVNQLRSGLVLQFELEWGPGLLTDSPIETDYIFSFGTPPGGRLKLYL